MFQLFLSICFIDPSCYQDTPPIVTNHQDNAISGTKLEYSSSTARELVDNLVHRRTEKARNILISKLMDAQTRIKYLMFKYIEIGVGARGVSVLATKNIIDAIKVTITNFTNKNFSSMGLSSYCTYASIKTNSKGPISNGWSLNIS